MHSKTLLHSLVYIGQLFKVIYILILKAISSQVHTIDYTQPKQNLENYLCLSDRLGLFFSQLASNQETILVQLGEQMLKTETTVHIIFLFGENRDSIYEIVKVLIVGVRYSKVVHELWKR